VGLAVDQVVESLALSLLPGLSPHQAHLLRARGSAGAILSRPRDHADLLPPRALASALAGHSLSLAEHEVAEARKGGFELVELEDARYPALLRKTHDPPLVLYAWGQLPGAPQPGSVSIVGSRACTPDGRALARRLGRDLAAAGLSVISGLARGIDSAAHAGALEGRGCTIAVLGSGLGCLYPAENALLAEQIAHSGAVVSEFPLLTPPYRAHFPRRNRIIAGWSPAIVVVEAGERSGALVTARLALDEGRDVYAVPGHPSWESARGTNQLIRDGAALIRSASDVLQEMGVETETPRRAVDAEADPLLRLMQADVACSLEELQARSGLAPVDLLRRLTQLELESRVRRVPGSLYVRG
jgi:DNA processing protein